MTTQQLLEVCKGTEKRVYLAKREFDLNLGYYMSIFKLKGGGYLERGNGD